MPQRPFRVVVGPGNSGHCDNAEVCSSKSYRKETVAPWHCLAIGKAINPVGYILGEAHPCVTCNAEVTQTDLPRSDAPEAQTIVVNPKNACFFAEQI